MKKILLTLALCMGSGSVFAADVWTSSTTVANIASLKMLCPKRALFHGICTNFGVASASTTVIASSWTYTDATANAGLGPVTTLVADQCKYYDVVFTNGLSYLKPNAANVTMMYQCY